jgi:CxxC motif-containing protein (DUF1111 family)
LTAGELREFYAGRALFQRTFTPAEGIGPTFNQNRCASCHDLPTIGGQGADFARKATRFADKRCDLLTQYGGDMLQSRITDELRAQGFLPETIPPGATAITNVLPPPLFGLGLIEAIPESEILERVDPDDRNHDGISGRRGTSLDGGLGRFGRKANFRSIHQFVAGALVGEMGLTSPVFPTEEAVGGKPVPPAADPHSDPEIDSVSLNRLARYVELLAPAAPDSGSSRATADSVSLGRSIFIRLRCSSCHVPQMRTGKSAVAALDRRRVPLYSDLLLHDLGPEDASICAHGAGPSEWRTTPLMGLRLRIRFLHDARAQSLTGAIEAHGGEAAASRNGFTLLRDEERERLMRFLRSL